MHIPVPRDDNSTRTSTRERRQTTHYSGFMVSGTAKEVQHRSARSAHPKPGSLRNTQARHATQQETADHVVKWEDERGMPRGRRRRERQAKGEQGRGRGRRQIAVRTLRWWSGAGAQSRVAATECPWPANKVGTDFWASPPPSTRHTPPSPSLPLPRLASLSPLPHHHLFESSPTCIFVILTYVLPSISPGPR
jgi:hypothetical protein